MHRLRVNRIEKVGVLRGNRMIRARSRVAISSVFRDTRMIRERFRGNRMIGERARVTVSSAFRGTGMTRERQRPRHRSVTFDLMVIDRTTEHARVADPSSIERTRGGRGALVMLERLSQTFLTGRQRPVTMRTRAR